MPAAIPAHTLGFIEKWVTNLMTDTALIEQHQGGTTGQYGEPSANWTTVALAQPCRLISIGGRYRSTAGAVGGEISLRDSYRFVVPNGGIVPDVGMRITVNGVRYDVLAVQSAQTNIRSPEALISRQRGEKT